MPISWTPVARRDIWPNTTTQIAAQDISEYDLLSVRLDAMCVLVAARILTGRRVAGADEGPPMRARRDDRRAGEPQSALNEIHERKWQ